MINTRILHLLALFFGAFALFAAAGPIDRAPSHNLAVRAFEENGLAPRGGQCNSAGCNEKALLDILIKLKADISIHIGDLDGHNSPSQPCRNIIARIQIAIRAILDLDVDVSGSVGSLIDQIVTVLIQILTSIIGGCGKYGLITLLVLLVELITSLDKILADLVGACCHVCPGLIPRILAFTLHVTWNLLGFTLTFLACGHKY